MKITGRNKVSGLTGERVNGLTGLTRKLVHWLTHTPAYPHTRTPANSPTRKLAYSLTLVFLFLTAVLCTPIFALEVSQTQNQSIFTAPLIWRGDGTGEHSFENASLSKASLAKDGSVVASASEGVCELSSAFATEGKITGLSATWVFTGEVTLEVSVTGNPKDYVRVTNGVPLEFKKRAAGSRIQWRATLAPQSTLSQVRIVYTDLSGVAGSFGSEFLSGFKVRKQIFVKGSTAGDLFQYQIPVKVGESQKSPDLCDVKLKGGILSDFMDVRFTLADGETVAPHFLENVSGPAPDRMATFWVKVPEIPAEGLYLYMYFSRAAADDISSAEKVFDLYEDFAGSALDPKKWKLTLGDKTGSASIADSLLLLKKAKLTTAGYEFSSGILEYQARVSGPGAVAGILRQTASGNNDLVAYASTLAGSEHAIAQSGDVSVNDAKPFIPGVFNIYRVQCDPKGALIFQRYNEKGEGDPEAQVRYVSGMNQASPVGLSSSNQEQSVECSWIRTRQHIEPAPAIDREKTAAGILEQVDLPEFDNVVTAPDGGLVTKPKEMEGRYISRPIKPAFAARILKPTWLVEDPSASVLGETAEDGAVSVSISTKDGAAYTPEWESGVTRYVSKKEFKKGGELRWKAVLKQSERVSESAGSTGAPANSLTRFSLEYYPGLIRVVRPSGNETLVSGTPYLIFWDAPGFGPKYPVEISYLSGGGKDLTVIASKTDNAGDFTWNVPDETTQTAFVRVTDYYDKNIFGVSEDPFSIQPTASVSETGAGSDLSDEQETRDYLLSGEGVWSKASAWVGAEVPNLASDVNLSTRATIVADQPLAFRRLVIGDGAGDVSTTLVLRAGIAPGSGEIVIRKGGKLVQANNLPQVITGDLIIEDGGILTHRENKAEKDYQLDLSARNILLKAGAVVNASGKGYSGGDEGRAGAGRAAGQYTGKKARGGRHTDDSERMPRELGSGGAGSWGVKGGAGGGAIRLAAANEFSINGIIAADGASGAVAKDASRDAAGGAGGSIYLAANKFSGSGAKITATGGPGVKAGGAGGGGRIHIKAAGGTISGVINANGGSGEDTSAGTVIVE